MYPADAINKVLNKEMVNKKGVNFVNDKTSCKTKYCMQYWVRLMIIRFSILINFKKAMNGFLSNQFF